MTLHVRHLLPFSSFIIGLAILTIGLGASSQLHAQVSGASDEAFEMDDFEVAAKEAKKVYKSSKDSSRKAMAALRVADSYYWLYNFNVALDWYDSSLVQGAKLTYMQHDRCFNSILITRRFEDYVRFQDRLHNEELLEIYRLKIEWIYAHQKPYAYTVTPMDINIGGTSLGLAIFRDSLLYSKPKSDGTYRLALAPIQKDSVLGPGEFLKGKIVNEKAYEGSPSVIHDSIIVYSGNSKQHHVSEQMNEYGKMVTNVTSSLELRRIDYIDGEFQKMGSKFKLDKEQNYATPFVTPDAQRIYFTSDIEGGSGGFDIYRSRRQSDGNWEEPQNLGAKINTKLNESYPIEFDGYLYFASRGHIGFGGFDIYRVKMIGDGFGEVEPLMQPINSSYDDFSLYPLSHKSGYLSTNRFNKDGSDRFAYVEIMEQDSIEIVAMDTIKSKPLEDIQVILYQLHENDTYKIKSGSIQEMSPLPLYKDFSYLVELDRTLEDGTWFFKQNANDHQNIMAKYGYIVFVFRDIYFEFDKAELTSLDKAVLHKVSNMLDSDPNVKVEVGGHTDSKGKAKYNQKLSAKRAQAVVDYLVNQGIQRERLIAVGYGESKILNHCVDDIECNDTEHAVNRRVEFKLIEAE